MCCHDTFCHVPFYGWYNRYSLSKKQIRRLFHAMSAVTIEWIRHVDNYVRMSTAALQDLWKRVEQLERRHDHDSPAHFPNLLNDWTTSNYSQ
jgi:hypothetical protein